MFMVSNLSDPLLQFWQLRQMPLHHLISHNSDSSLRPNHDSLLLILKLVCRFRCSQDMAKQLKNLAITICNFIISLILFSSILSDQKQIKRIHGGPKGLRSLGSPVMSRLLYQAELWAPRKNKFTCSIKWYRVNSMPRNNYQVRDFERLVI